MGEEAERVAGRTSTDRLLVLTGYGDERRLTDALQQPFLSIKPMRVLSER